MGNKPYTHTIYQTLDAKKKNTIELKISFLDDNGHLENKVTAVIIKNKDKEITIEKNNYEL